MVRKKRSKESDTTCTDALKPPQTLEEAEVYLAKPTTRQILDYYSSSPYLYETAWAYRSIDPSAVTDLLDDSKPEDVLRRLPTEDILEIHDVLNVEQFRPGVIQWDELDESKDDEDREVEHWVTAKDIKVMGKLYNKSNVSEGLWMQAVLGLKKELVDNLFGKARMKDKARKRRLNRKKEMRKRMKDEEGGVQIPAQTASPVEGAEEGSGPIAKDEQTEELARTATNGSDASKKNHKHRGKKRKANDLERTEDKKIRKAQKSKTESGNSEKKKAKRARRAQKQRSEAGNVERVTTIPSYIPSAQTENGTRQVETSYEESESHIPEKQKDGQSNTTTKRVSFIIEERVDRNVVDNETLSSSSSGLADDEEHNNDGQNDDDLQDDDQDVDIQEHNNREMNNQQDTKQEDEEYTATLPLPSSPTLGSRSSSLNTPPSTPHLQPTTPVIRATRSATRTKSPLKSPYFASITTPSSSASTSPRRTPKGTSAIPFPPLSASSFGLIQEALAHNPFHLLIAVQFLNKTRGSVAIPVIHQLIAIYPTPADLAVADPADIVPLIRHLGLQNQRARKLVEFGKMWVAHPPIRGKRYRTLNYPTKGAGKGIEKDEVIEDEQNDARGGAWEVAHLPGVGAYAIDSWRIFCRDALRGVAKGWDGEGAKEKSKSTQNTINNDEAKALESDQGATEGTNTPDEFVDNDMIEGGFEPEWQRVLPLDKELRAFLRWMWLKKHNLSWNPITGRTTPASKEMLAKVEKGGCVVEELYVNSQGEACHGENGIEELEGETSNVEIKDAVNSEC